MMDFQNYWFLTKCLTKKKLSFQKNEVKKPLHLPAIRKTELNNKKNVGKRIILKIGRQAVIIH